MTFAAFFRRLQRPRPARQGVDVVPRENDVNSARVTDHKTRTAPAGARLRRLHGERAVRTTATVYGEPATEGARRPSGVLEKFCVILRKARAVYADAWSPT
ncbi:hypothetical protein GCM10018772_22920 [Streptomyces fumanus]|uniref:Uncharacterized protein n=1 Tax=Streptomyces fumanus TaxID=67302 RepID=A0A919ABW3_9ACTN|nr:hypothetical protein GCM10018772_22920 [Streptomyces fumanus]